MFAPELPTMRTLSTLSFALTLGCSSTPLLPIEEPPADTGSSPETTSDTTEPNQNMTEGCHQILRPYA